MCKQSESWPREHNVSKMRWNTLKIMKADWLEKRADLGPRVDFHAMNKYLTSLTKAL